MSKACREQVQFDSARRFCRDALHAAEEIDDPWASAPAWLALAETERDAGCSDEAAAAFTRAIAIYERLGVAQEIAYAETLRAIR